MSDDMREPVNDTMTDPFDELYEMDLRVELAGMDDEDRAFDANTHPKPLDGSEEGTTDRDGRLIAVEDELGMLFSQDLESIEDIVLGE